MESEIETELPAGGSDELHPIRLKKERTTRPLPSHTKHDRGMNRLTILLASIAIELCLGGIYAWSVFAVPLHGVYGLTMTQTQVIFGTAIAVNTLAMVFAGRLLPRFGTRIVASGGGVLLAAGYILAALSHGSFAMLWVSLGVILGTGLGFCYVCPLAVCIKLFPEHRGLVTGLAVAGFGAGSILLANAASYAMDTHNADVLSVFLTVGIVYGAVIIISSLFLGHTSLKGAKPNDYHLRSALRQPEYIGLIAAMFAGTFAGLLVIGNLKPMGLAGGIAAPLAALAVSAFALGNASGRVLWGLAYDRFGRSIIPLALLITGISVVALQLSRTFAPAFIIAAVVAGLSFGACFVIFAARLAQAFGADAVPKLYPIILLAYGLSGITGPYIGGRLYDATGSYAPATLIAAAIAIAGVIAHSILNQPSAALKLLDHIAAPLHSAFLYAEKLLHDMVPNLLLKHDFIPIHLHTSHRARRRGH